MSTITKLDPNVRLDRYLRKEQRREMRKDTKKIEELIARGERAQKQDPSFPAASRKLLGDLRVRRIVMTLMLKHITKICRDPARTGARKEAILDKLGGAQA